jgi:hypothetical protein
MAVRVSNAGLESLGIARHFGRRCANNNKLRRTHMRKLLVAACLSMLALAPVHANDISKKTGKPLTDQQQKMRDCSAQAKEKGLKKDERKSYMKDCMGKGKAKGGGAARAEAAAPADAAAEAKRPQKGKMKACNAEAKAKGLSGDDRKAFMSDCLKA